MSLDHCSVLLSGYILTSIAGISEGVIEVVTHHAGPISLAFVALVGEDILRVCACLILPHLFIIKINMINRIE